MAIYCRPAKRLNYKVAELTKAFEKKNKVMNLLDNIQSVDSDNGSNKAMHNEDYCCQYFRHFGTPCTGYGDLQGFTKDCNEMSHC